MELGPGLFSGVFMILKMWVHRVYGTSPRCIFGHFKNVDAWVCGAGPGLFSGVFMILKMWVHWVYGTGPWCIFGHFENVDAWVCGASPRLFSGVFMILKMWVHWVYGTGPWCIFGHCENVDAWVCGEKFPALLDASFLCFNRSRAFQQYQYTYIIHHSQLRVFLPLEFTKNLGNRPQLINN